MRVAFCDYQNKGLPLALLLQQAGHELVPQHLPFDVLFVDCDYPWAGDRVAAIEQAADFGAAVAVYPHGGAPLFFYDGICDPHPDVSAHLVSGPGQRRFQERFEHKQVIEVGFYWCDQKPLERKQPENVLFAPMHPWSDGLTIATPIMEANREAFEEVCDLGLPVTVRYLGEMEPNGIEPRPGVKLIRGQKDNSYDDIDRHDLVVAMDTYASLALARGKPVVMMGQDLIPHNDEYTQPVAGFGEYRHEVRYPLSIGDDSLPVLIERAVRGTGQKWRQEFVGPPATVKTVKRALDLIVRATI